MNKTYVLIIFSFALNTLFMNLSYAQNYGDYKRSTKQQIKCYVKVVGERKSIYLTIGNLNQTTLANSIVSVNMYIPELQSKRRIVEVYECVAYDKIFSDLNAQKLEEHTVF